MTIKKFALAAMTAAAAVATGVSGSVLAVGVFMI
jgi:hypothetical protein